MTAPLPSLRHGVRADLARDGLAPRKKLGQHFLVDRAALACMVEQIAPAPGVRVLEVGPGTGILTGPLLAAGATVLAVELDRGLAAALRQRQDKNLELLEADILASKTRLHPAVEAWVAAGPWVLGSNLPYDVSIPVILNCLALPTPPSLVVAMVQREAAERLCAAAGADAWGATAAVAQASGSGRIARRVPPGAFHPPPRVDSAILRWDPVRLIPPGYPAFCRALFAYRRKVLSRGLRHMGLTVEAALHACAAAGVQPQTRVETIPVADLLRLQAAVNIPETEG